MAKQDTQQPSPQKVVMLACAVFSAGLLLFAGAAKQSFWHVLLPASGMTYIFLSFYQKKFFRSKE